MEKIQVKPMSHEVADRIREMIRTDALHIGCKINETELCTAMGVSRTPVREALRLLSAEGLIHLVPRVGAFVTRPRKEDIRDMFQVMSVLEATCARICTEKMSEEDFAKIEALHRELEEHHSRRDREGYLQCNHRFHSFVQEVTGNKILNEVLDSLRQKLLLYRFRQLSQPERFDQSMQEHRALLEAFRKRNAREAETLMGEHLMRQCDALISLYAEDSSPKCEGHGP